MLRAATAVQLLSIAGGMSAADFSCKAPEGYMSWSIVSDIHDGDYKCAFFSQSSSDVSPVIFKPYNNKESWTVTTMFNTTSCQALVDFRVPGKPNPPPVPLLMTWSMAQIAPVLGAGPINVLFFNDESGVLGPAWPPLNMWVTTNTSTDKPLC